MQRALIALTCMALLAVQGAPVAAKGKPFRYSGSGCTEVQATVPVPPERVQPYVPEPFTIATTAGMAQVYVGFVSCQVVRLAGRAGRPGMVSEVGVQIAAPNTGGTGHVYSLWQLNDRADLRAGLKRLGMEGARIKMEFEVAHLGGAVPEFRSNVPWPRSAYSATGHGVEPLRDVGTVRSTWWHSGPKGPLRIDYLLPEVELGAAVGSLEVEDGTPLQEILGTSIPTLPLLVYRFDFTAAALRAPF